MPRADALEHVVEIRIVQRPRHDRHRLHPQGERHRAHLPVAEVSGKQQHTTPFRMRLPDTLLPFRLEVRQDLVVRQRSDLDQLEQHAAEMGKHAADRRAPLLERFRRQSHARCSPARSGDESRQRCARTGRAQPRRDGQPTSAGGVRSPRDRGPAPPRCDIARSGSTPSPTGVAAATTRIRRQVRWTPPAEVSPTEAGAHRGAARCARRPWRSSRRLQRRPPAPAARSPAASAAVNQ